MRALAAAIAVTAVPRLVLAGGSEVAQQSAVATATGSAGTARPDDPSLAWFNPAGLANGGGLKAALGVTLGMTSFHAEATADAEDGPWEADTESGVATPAHVYLSYAADNWAVGISVNTPFGSRVRWPGDWAQRFDIVSSEFQSLRIAPFGAYRIGPVSLAVGPQFDFARVELRRATNHVSSEGSSVMVLSGNGFGAQAAVFAELTPTWHLGLSYKSRTTLPMDGDVDFSIPPPFDEKFPDQHVAVDWNLPDRIALGTAVRFADVRLLLDVTYTLWAVNEKYAFDFSDDVTEDREQINEWRSSLALRGGAEYLGSDWYALRAGAYLDGIPSPPPPDERLAPSAPDSTRLGLTLGGSIRLLEGLWVDVAYEHLRLFERTSTSEDAPLASYDGMAHLIGVGLNYAWAPGVQPALPH